MANWFYKIYQWGEKNKLLFFISVVLFISCMAFGAWNIKFEEDITRILPKSEKSNVTAKVLEQLRFSDKITVIIEKQKGGTTDDMVELASHLFDTLATKKAYIKHIQGKIEDENINETIAFVYQNLPLFLDEADYQELEQKIQLDSVAQTVEANYKTLVSPTSLVAKQFIQKDPFGIGFIALKKLQKLNIGDGFQLIDGFLFNKEEDKLLLFIDPVYSGSDTAHNTDFIAFLNGIKEEFNHKQEQVTIDYFGASFVAVANATQIKSDIQQTVAISITVLMLLLIAFYRRITIPVILFIPTFISALVALFFLYFMTDTISAISLSIGAILIGITIDYALHIMTHYKHCNDIKVLYQEITNPIMMSASTTAIAFLCLVFVHSEALRDLGVFASITVMGAGIISLLLIPHLYKPSAKDRLNQSSSLLDKIAHFPFDQSKVLLGLCGLIILISLFTFKNVKFNSDLSSLNYFPEELKQAEQKLESTVDSGSKSLYLTCFGEDIEQVVEQNVALAKQLEQAKAKGEILHFSSLGDFVLSTQQQRAKIAQWEHFWSKKKANQFIDQFKYEGAKYGFNETAYQPFFALLHNKFEPIGIKDYSDLNPQIIDEFLIEKNGHYTLSTVVKLPEEHRQAFMEQFPSSDHFIVIDRKEMNETFLGNIVNDFNDLVNYSFLAVFAILWLFFRRIELVIVSMIPIVITGLITAGLMGLFHIEFNIFSTIVCTIIFGQGVDFTIFITNALQKEYTTGEESMPTYRASIILAVLTTLLAVGTLVFAKHPALKSISFVSIIGMSVAAINAFVIYPRLFKICFVNRQQKGNSPITLRLLLHSMVSFLYFGVFGFLYSMLSKVFLLVAPGKERTKLRMFSKGMHWYMTSVLYLNAFVRKKVRNPHKETFEKPAIIIANHTSFLDSLVMGMVYPNVVYLVNDWVYKSPIFGKAIQSAGFYRVSEGVDNSIDHLKKRVEMGFSLMIFPEGTRSHSNVVQRFHKGAFFLAETLQLDVVPVYIHGNSETIPKGDYIIYDGHIIATVGKRIPHNDASFGTTYTQRTKAISKHFKAEFAQIRTELEDVDYFKKKVFWAYLYKFPYVVKAVKADYKLYRKFYFEVNQHLPAEGGIHHIADDYGQLNMLLTLQQSKRKIYSYIADKEHREVANTLYIVKKRKIHYGDTLEVQSKCETLLVSSVNTTLTTDFIAHYQTIIVLKKAGVLLETYEGFTKITENNYVVVWNKVHDGK
ncbi:1-acyl-sn-glycerol-3-phosphate acyltransferase [Myroides odoratus]|uniref:1-acyl-sn-glycerol-3-phosphate acyltransferase n=1 Tax=Myroides odoratus TaxID=256 RepID=A0A9Q6Z4F2_MYROD|nr:1-acyl-sn-glycerol-3-phosphate acyltransferase [Myroides odoratus]EHQ42535.1 phospholipid/glycerol acyltransferase [Myroides odoratus DSM 2801]EKB07916.1 1-acylglycerol-3-phosphate O-acyltransferase [Myroides odoratus CIP 103059]QQT99905.1 1-acyl-sn-glycerol-3-phosphate acyltransferase [Myroides odoratus]WQD57879.1 1-acyl-sn-glycerol-3-phosphate acyltransferase [Myroides odoratus]STZ29797.1 2-acyl-glycerophospho-ethanolamine acyltransferase [Myroides odoratus]